MTMPESDFENLDGVSVTKLHLDPQNPRHDPIQDEAEIIAQLYKTEQVLNLAKDIVAKGTLSPLERNAVIKMNGNPGHYIVLEGNRRICALKLLHDPDKAPDSEARNALSRLAERFAVPALIPLVLFEDRQAARPWLELRHLGAQNGAGTRTWSPSQKARFDEGGSPDQLALAVLDRAQASGWINDEQRKKFAITTLTRYLSNPIVRDALGLGSNRELQYTHDASEVDTALQQFLADATKGDDSTTPLVHSRSRKSEREAYARGLRDRGVAPQTVLPSPVHPPEPGKQSKPRKPRGKRHPGDRRYLVPSDFVITHSDKALIRLWKELRDVQIDNHEFAVNYLLRALVERVMVCYAKRCKVYRPKMTDEQLVRECVTQLGNDGVVRNVLKPMRVALSNPDSAHSLHTLGASVHTGLLPSRKSLIAAWENWETALKLMLERL